MPATLKAQANTHVDQIALTKRTIDHILNQTHEEIKYGKILPATESLVYRLGKISIQFLSEVFRDWIRDYCTAHPTSPKIL